MTVAAMTAETDVRRASLSLVILSFKDKQYANITKMLVMQMKVNYIRGE